jgi:hypothetical protein
MRAHSYVQTFGARSAQAIKLYAGETSRTRAEVRKMAGVSWIRKALTSPRMLVVICMSGHDGSGWRRVRMGICAWEYWPGVRSRIGNDVRRMQKEKFLGKQESRLDDR